MSCVVAANMQLDVTEDSIFSQSPASRPRKDSNDSSASETNLSVLAREDEADIDDDSSSCGQPSFTDGETDNVDNLSTGKDSGIDSSNGSEEDFVIPSEELTQKIIKQVEFYFSDANILKDSFLLKHVRRNREGYVSLKLMASFRKVKSLTKNWKVVAYSLRQSEKLEVNSEGTKVRRRDPIPEYDETTPSRTIVAFNLPFEKSTIENVGELFSKCGDITLIRILRPGGAVPTDVKRFIHKHPEIGSSICAVIEFEKHEAANKAVEMDSKNSDWRSLHVLPLAQKAQSSRDLSTILCNGKTAQSQDGKTKKKKNKQQQKRVVELRSDESPVVSSCSENDSPRPRRRYTVFTVNSMNSSTPNSQESANVKRLGAGGNGQGSTSPSNRSPVGPRKTAPNNKSMPNRQKSHSQGDVSSPIGISPWVQKRMLAARGSSHSESSSVVIDVIRQPRGPDGTKGFQWDRSKPRTMSAPVSLMVTAY